jgi:hypothetical protein
MAWLGRRLTTSAGDGSLSSLAGLLAGAPGRPCGPPGRTALGWNAQLLHDLLRAGVAAQDVMQVRDLVRGSELDLGRSGLVVVVIVIVLMSHGRLPAAKAAQGRGRVGEHVIAGRGLGRALAPT